MRIFQLMAGQFVDNQRIRTNRLCLQKCGNTDISHQQRIRTNAFENMPGQSSSCTFALSAGDSDHLFAVSAQKQLGLRSDPLQYSDRFIGKDNPR